MAVEVIRRVIMSTNPSLTELCCCGKVVANVVSRGSEVRRAIPSNHYPIISRAVEDYLLSECTLDSGKSLDLHEYPIIVQRFCNASAEFATIEQILALRQQLINSKTNYSSALSQVQEIESFKNVLLSFNLPLLIPCIDE